MKTIRTTAVLATCLLSAAAWAQSNQPLNLKLPANVPAASASSADPASTSAVATDSKPAENAPAATSGAANASTTAQANTGANTYAKDPPGTYYGDTSGAPGRGSHAQAQAPGVTCDDATYNQPQVHGAVGMGVASGSHVSGSYTGGVVSLSQAFGSCEHPSGGMSISVGGTSSHYGH
ncbi:hypothetical protein DVT68_12575 [Dyella solisilvae]|uniref:Uncharacterized protein n=1 Tax=Dyella solisilvae TaxID=1920168 RepID=A0A370K648_9GAMM|nr:hypothetical protein [Dyella solisilvae]RDI97927.1 hypothetical protein DVT68_12575 [Dyella solisilvae]